MLSHGLGVKWTIFQAGNYKEAARYTDDNLSGFFPNPKHDGLPAMCWSHITVVSICY